MNVKIRDYVSNDHVMNINEVAQTQGMAIQAYMLENEQLQRELKEVYDRLTNKDKQISQLTNNWNELEEDINNKIKDIKMNFSQVNGNYFNMNDVIDVYEEVLDKMKEIKEGNK